ncbi:MAG: guanylate kinase [Pelagibacteraceae bacterium TMED287]|nr:MAG: guanylate kinase [Pelagibacteraceae bacterium TMED287]|tara:strand:- start:711 stop:1343 length:633 start_codon:yes stop_codon:yes gene_type:complete
MSLRKDGIMIVLSSPSGAGKTTLVKLLSKKKNNSISVSFTTRKPRPNEKNKRDYFFVSKKYFKLLIKKKSFLEHAKVFNNYYGSSKKLVIDKLKKGKNVLFDIDWQGTEKIKKKKLKFNLITIFILPPSKKVLFRRLSNRDMKDKLIVEQRMKQFEKDVLHWKKYNYVVINDKLNSCLSQILNIISNKLNKKKISFNKEKITKHVNKLIS